VPHRKGEERSGPLKPRTEEKEGEIRGGKRFLEGTGKRIKSLKTSCIKLGKPTVKGGGENWPKRLTDGNKET